MGCPTCVYKEQQCQLISQCIGYNQLDNRRWMLNLKVKIKSRDDSNPSRRIRTEANQPKKGSFYHPKPKQPLAQNKRIHNDNDSLPLKRQKPTRTIPLKATTKLNTQAHCRDPLTTHQRQAADKLFNQRKDTLNSRRDQREADKMEGQNRYAIEQKVGSGTFGVVHKARDRKTLELVAIKRVYQDKKYKNRELQILKTLNHPNVLRIRDSFYTYQGQKEYLNVVMDYFPCNLYQMIQSQRGKQIPPLKMKVLTYQLLRGLLYLGQQGIAHRDMKPQNVLVDDQKWKLLICDFGSAKQLVAGEPNLAYICSRCYRAPQLIFGCTEYSSQIDVWSAGCILIQMVLGEPVFRADSNIDQLVEIIKVLGTPSRQQIIEMNPDCDLDKYQFPSIAPRSWEKLLRNKSYGQSFYQLLAGLMRYSPSRRLTPAQALKQPFFDELRDQKTYNSLRKHYKIPELFELGDGKLGLLPSWWQ